MTEPNDRELEQYLKGDSPLSRRYREASGERAPPELDEAILAQARAELKRKPRSLNRWLAPVALAASLVLGVNLAWNVYQASPMPGQPPAPAESRDDVFVPEPPPPMASAPEARNDATAMSAEPTPQPERKARAAAPPLPPFEEQLKEQPKLAADSAAALERDADLATRQREQAASEQEAASLRKTESQERMASARQETPAAARSEPQASGVAPAAVAAPSLADAAPMPEAARIDHLINYIGNLRGATFVRNGKDYGAAEAAKHLQYKREKAGDRIKTADDFIRLCASHSYLSGEAYLIRFADGRTRTAEDVLREELARISAGG